MFLLTSHIPGAFDKQSYSYIEPNLTIQKLQYNTNKHSYQWRYSLGQGHWPT